MKRLTAFTVAVLLCCATATAQQAQVEKRTSIPYAYKDFRKATVEFSFGKDKVYDANIFLKDGSLLYKKDTTVMKAELFGVISVDFGDAKYRKTGLRMGKILAQKGDVMLTVVTTIDTGRMQEDARSGRNSTFLDLPEFNLFVETNADYWAGNEGVTWPLKDEYFFIVNGETIQAAEKIIKKRIRSDKKSDFKELMKNRKWSWRDAKSLEVLIDYF